MKQNAKAEIINSFKQLLNKKSIDKITVEEICEHCIEGLYRGLGLRCKLNLLF